MTTQQGPTAEGDRLADEKLAVESPLKSAPQQDREAVARIIWFVHGDGSNAADAMSPANDAHWRHWREHEDARDAWTAADAILALTRKEDDYRRALERIARGSAFVLENRPAICWEGGDPYAIARAALQLPEGG